jgi:hypothetical protein
MRGKDLAGTVLAIGAVVLFTAFPNKSSAQQVSTQASDANVYVESNTWWWNGNDAVVDLAIMNDDNLAVRKIEVSCAFFNSADAEIASFIRTVSGFLGQPVKAHSRFSSRVNFALVKKDPAISDAATVSCRGVKAERTKDNVTKDNVATPSNSQLAGYWTYDQLARTPDAYAGQTMSFSGKVVQAIQEGEDRVLRIAFPPNERDIFWVEYRASPSPRILEGDVVDVRAKFVGIKSYKTVLGATVQVPHVIACEVKSVPQSQSSIQVLRPPQQIVPCEPWWPRVPVAPAVQPLSASRSVLPPGGAAANPRVPENVLPPWLRKSNSPADQLEAIRRAKEGAGATQP